jgi:sporulation protein YlmC with PRC-barrel domain
MNTIKILATAVAVSAFTLPAAAQNAQVDPLCITKNADGSEQVDRSKCPDGMKPGMASGDAAANSSAATQTDPAATTGSTTKAGEIFIPGTAFGGAKLFTASDFIGKRIYNPAGEDIGEVNDVLLSEDGSVHAVILGVGGFLGMGEKNVAISMKAIQVNAPADGSAARLVVETTKEQLTAAGAFDPKTRTYLN